MGTTGTAAVRQQPLITNGLGGPSQYTNGDYRQTNDSSPTRPLSQSLISSSTSNQSRPNTSGAQSNSTTNTNISNHHSSPSLRPLLGGGQQPRPGSTGTDVVPQPAMRHGFAEAYSSEEYLTMLEQVSIIPSMQTNFEVFYMYFTYDRHESAATPTNTSSSVIEDWRPRERLST